MMGGRILTLVKGAGSHEPPPRERRKRPDRAPEKLPTVEEITATIREDDHLAESVGAFLGLLDSNTWLSEMIDCIVSVSAKSGYLDLARRPWAIEDLVADDIRNLADDLRNAVKMRRMYGPLLKEKGWYRRKLAEYDKDQEAAGRGATDRQTQNDSSLNKCASSQPLS